MPIQQKYFVGSNISNDLESQGVILGPERLHEYIYFPRNGIYSENILTRIRSYERRFTLDHKFRASRDDPWIKYETGIDDLSQMKLILAHLGMTTRAVLSKRFRSWINEILILDVVTVNDLFTVLEAKFSVDDAASATEFVRSLGFDPSRSDPRSSVDIYLEMKGEE